jgi:hypothetical protein
MGFFDTAVNTIGAVGAAKNGDYVGATQFGARAAQDSGIPGIQEAGRTVGQIADTVSVFHGPSRLGFY